MSMEQPSITGPNDPTMPDRELTVRASRLDTLDGEERLALSERLERRHRMIDSSFATNFDDDDQTPGDLTEQELA